jgi:hypothetical protein
MSTITPFEFAQFALSVVGTGVGGAGVGGDDAVGGAGVGGIAVGGDGVVGVGGAGVPESKLSWLELEHTAPAADQSDESHSSITDDVAPSSAVCVTENDFGELVQLPSDTSNAHNAPELLVPVTVWPVLETMITPETIPVPITFCRITRHQNPLL